ncbi:heme-copper oxidase subunit III [Halobacteriales archaeon QS_1_68_17]|nr:MAG: heme-copper oxidase subunit III [Halobacteriales archaeon QS_1_68_17]
MSLADDAEESGGHHLPAVEDWPRGFGEASWWPFVTAFGAAGIYAGAGLSVLGRGEDAVVGTALGPAVVAASVLVFLGGLYGWLYHGFVASFWEHGTDEHASQSLRLGMVLFLASEIATFGAGFAYYFFVRVGTWPPSELPHLLSSLVAANTLVLVASSVTLHLAHVGLRRGDRTRFLRLLGLTLLLGVVFVAGQAYEYYDFVVGEGLTLSGGVFESAFFGLTGLHGLHVSLGAVLLGIVLVRGLYGQYSADRHTSVSTASMYWHFVDAVWLFLVVVLYVGSTV